MNPVRAGIVKRPEDYAWSSYRYYVGDESGPCYFEKSFLLGCLGQKERQAKQAMEAFVEAGLEKEVWNPMDDVAWNTILGKSEFVDWIKQRFIMGKEEDRDIPEIKSLKKIDADRVSAVVTRKLAMGSEKCIKIQMYLMRKYCPMTLREIGDRFGGIGVSGVNNAVRKMEQLRKQDLVLDRELDGLEESILCKK